MIGRSGTAAGAGDPRSRRRRATPSVPWRARIPEVVLLLIALGAAAMPLWPVYQHPGLIITVAGALFLGTGVAAIGAVRRQSWWFTVAAGAFVYLLAGVPLAVPTAAANVVIPTLDGLADLLVATVASWKELLTAVPPIGTYRTLLVPPFLVFLITSAWGVSVLLRADRRGWIMILPIAALGFGTAFGSAEGFLAEFSGLTVLAAVVFAAVLRSMQADHHDPAVARPQRTVGPSRSSRPRRLRRIGGAGLLFVCCAVAGWLLQPATSDRIVLRDVVEPPITLAGEVSPLSAFRGQVVSPGAERELFTVSGLPDDARLRLAVLDAYDGQVFSRGGIPTDEGTIGLEGFARVPSTIAGPSRTDESRVTVAVTVREGSGVWFPTPGRLESVRFSGAAADDVEDAFRYDRSSSTGIVTTGIRSGSSARLTAVLPAVADDSALAASVAGPAAQPEFAAVPDALIAAAAQRWAPDATPGERMSNALDWLRTGYLSHGGPDDAPSLPGHSADRLDRLATESPMIGDQEQYAAAFVVIARSIGFPARVVVGFDPPAGARVVTGAHATAWAEVQLAGGTWITVDPTPAPGPVPELDEVTNDAAARPQTVLPPPPLQRDRSDPLPRDDDEQDAEEDSEPAWAGALRAALAIAGPVFGGLALLTMPFWGAMAFAALRRRRRRRDDDRRVVMTGLWREVEDVAVDHGVLLARSWTRLETAAAIGGPSTVVLARRIDRSVFGSGTPAIDEVASAWDELAAVRSGLGSGSRLERVLIRLRWRSAARHLQGLTKVPRRMPPPAA